MGALAVYRLRSPRDWTKLAKTLSTGRQLKLGANGPVENPSEPHSTLKLLSEDRETGVIRYAVKHFTDVVDEPIRVFLDDTQKSFVEIDSAESLNRTRTFKAGYQRIKTFNMEIDLPSREVRIFATKSVATAFVRRLQQSGVMQLAPLYIELQRIEEIADIEKVVGLWINSAGPMSKQAFFGDVDLDAAFDAERFNVLNVRAVIDPETTVDLCIGADCKISARGPLTQSQLVSVFENIKRSQILYESEGAKEPVPAGKMRAVQTSSLTDFFVLTPKPES
jgi:hypothetical protein